MFDYSDDSIGLVSCISIKGPRVAVDALCLAIKPLPSVVIFKRLCGVHPIVGGILCNNLMV